ncbi:MAG: 50S ribosomal protein L29 [Planctomycetes bacterium]|jgi:large subunit ribosomal protein L29|nr:50S ribosomal protein L29 [Planctomycetota bacterium]MBT6453061.1 50S ribosomal protein L29 [Planctomycetota bacterium]MBT6541109.1 50S ribosomal protein L29 [Planctomycetota bacterium]MBT6785046.1 50S ribosomal protein L29 [Planctomycetota bacterium]MBT6968099.1 50S ribosomal protein L29 [Planctomycetota bacterium]
MKISEFRQLPDEDLTIEIRKRREGLFKIRFKAANEETQRAGEIREMRKDIARMNTVLRERTLERDGSSNLEA